MLRNIDWQALATEIVDELRAIQSGPRIVTLRLREILRRAGNPLEPQGFRTRGFWKAFARGDRCTAFKSRGLTITVVPDRKGCDVQEITFQFGNHAA